MIKKRGKGKNTNCLGLREMYRFYRENYEAIDYKTFSRVVKACNRELVRTITIEAAEIQLPYRLGKLQVCKFERSYDQPQNKWKVDWKRTNEVGYKVYFDQKYIYKWCWKKHSSVVKNKTGYRFEASREAKRTVPRLLSTKKIDYLR